MVYFTLILNKIFDINKLYIFTIGYKWSDGSAVNYTNWGSGEPNDADGTDDCVEYNSGMRKWNDNSCYLAKNFACKIKLGVQLKTTLATPPPTNARKTSCRHSFLIKEIKV